MNTKLDLDVNAIIHYFFDLIVQRIAFIENNQIEISMGNFTEFENQRNKKE
ncbi:hypothetical protein SK629_2087 [Streptococcus mitis]|jgi:ATPase subunit of ABC transporter with duplicated ATPase domains|uniref:Uncharacterized protein n=1 Tax=Streptococcus mitis TaxID=28037 RepID=A0A081PT18_STRMT|nr:hypothetical protein [Streptococcus mitis]KEQ33841.1 hypothetical protein SK629_2087 [Streptococcus mitis]